MVKNRTLFQRVIISAAVLLGVSFAFRNPVKAEEYLGYTVDEENSLITIDAELREGGEKSLKNIFSYLNEALEVARDAASDEHPMTVKIPEGTYVVDGASSVQEWVRIYSNTTLDFSEAKLLFRAGTTIVTGTNFEYMGQSDYNNSALCAGYNGFRNITIKGGTIDSGNKYDESGKWQVGTRYVNTSGTVRMFHATNVQIEGITFTGGNAAHIIEVAAIDGLTIKGCTFKNWTGKYDADTKRHVAGKFEAIQLDIVANDDVFCWTYEDATMLKNVVISGCTFDHVERGVGTHTQLLGYFHDNVKITGNTFLNTKEEAIIVVGYRNSSITKNKFVDCAAGIVFENFAPSSAQVITRIYGNGKSSPLDVSLKSFNTNSNSVISGNVISIKKGSPYETVGIKVSGKNILTSYTSVNPDNSKQAWGKIPANNYYISNVTVTSNKITGACYGIHLKDAVNCSVKSNTITGVTTTSSYKAIYLSDASSKSAIRYNVVNSIGGYGLYVSGDSSLSGSVSGNTIKGTTKSAVYVLCNTASTGIKDNTLATASTTEPCVYIDLGKKNSVKLAIKNNKIYAGSSKTGIGVRIISGIVSVKNNAYSKIKYQCQVTNEKGKVITLKNTAVNGFEVVAKSKGFQASFKKKANVAGYYVVYATDANFTKNVVYKKISAKDSSVRIKNLKAKKYYYVKVYAYYTVGNTVFTTLDSKVIKVKTKS